MVSAFGHRADTLIDLELGYCQAMFLRVVGAGLGRTGTLSLKAALERLLGGPCYHGSEVFTRPDHVDSWTSAARGEPVDWHALFDGFHATVDWPAAAFWKEIAAAFPDALILLSTRESVDSWYRSAHETIFQYAPFADTSPVLKMFATVLDARFTPDAEDPEAAKAAYERHNAHVRATAPGDRLVEWTPRDGWGPLCEALGVPVPAEPFPRLNTKDDWDKLVDPEAIAAAGAEYAALVDELTPHVRDDTPVDDARVRALVERWDAAGADLHGGNEQMKAIVRSVLRENREELARQLSRSPAQMDDVFRYLDRAEQRLHSPSS